jgi:integrase
MSKQFEYSSVFAPYFDSFLKMKDTMGYGLNKFRWIFLEFDRFFLETSVTDVYITSEQIASWRRTRVNDKARTLYDKYSVLSQFCRYMCHIGHECYIPRLPKRKDVDFIPYVFTHEQMESIFRECDRLTMRFAKMNSAIFAIPALIRFLYSTGVRIGEALSVKNADVNYSRHQIIIRKTKNKMQRMVPVNSSLEEAMRQYETYRNRIPIENLTGKESFYFVSTVGKPLTNGIVYGWFKKVLRQCGIPHIGKNQGPRVHDIRHTSAVHSFEKMVRDGIDINCALPILSIFLGHKTIKGTERYVRMVREIYPDIIGMENPVTSFVFPDKPQIDIDHGNNY